MQRAQARILPQGRLHLQHGPIDLIVDAHGTPRDVAYAPAARRFETVLEELVSELPALRRQSAGGMPARTPVGRRMVAAVAPFAAEFVTPMAAVAGAVADEILAEILTVPGIRKAYVNNGGDVAVHLRDDEVFRATIAASPPATIILSADAPVRGIATSGWQGRSQSMGIADSVTVLAGDAAMADAAATLIANAVDLPGRPGIGRTPACDLKPDSDLGNRPVTTAVPLLDPSEKIEALNAGLDHARTYCGRGLIHAAWLVLQGETCCTAHPAFLETADA
ncbi:MAG: UPF0280 family protein [Rhodobacter sp.]|nr:UPF0280 family protein [Rhodobacter sp.]